MIGGVAAGMANFLGWPVAIVRIFWVLLLLPGGLPGLIPYLILWVIIPSEKASAEESSERRDIRYQGMAGGRAEKQSKNEN